MSTMKAPNEDGSERLHSPATYAHPDRECDVVMKGGITSGVVYPLAICEIAERYRLKNVGGTSAGAIAAAAAAAAEYGRLPQPGNEPVPGSGFPGLTNLPAWLGAGTNLLDLFQPAPSTAPTYRILVAAIRQRRGALAGLRRVLSLLGRLGTAGLFTRYVPIVLLATVPALGMLWALSRGSSGDGFVGLGLLLAGAVGVGALAALRRPRSEPPPAPCVPARELARIAAARAEARRSRRRLDLVAAALLVLAIAVSVVLHRAAADPDLAWGFAAGWLLLLLGAIGGLAASAALAAGRAIPENLYGLVAGAGSGGSVALSDWLSRLINQLAGRSPAGTPLTFGDLRRGPDTSPSEDPDCTPFVNLEMLTTCLTQGRPYRLPNGLDRFWFFDEADFRRLFPPEVVNYLTTHAYPPLRTPSEQAEWDRLVAVAKADGLHPLPDPDDLPVVVATRLSLSFPMLMSAVPLFTVDRSCPPEDTTERLERCWFSDGGITSNFPVSFFDALLPRRPTFGINLRSFHPAHPPSGDECENVWMPPTNSGGILEVWHRKAASTGFVAVAEFLAAILDTMQNWVDNRQLQVPGFRDRIVHISHGDTEGGMNLDMPPEVLARLSERGRCAGARLVEFYTRPPEGDRVVSWENHRWVRLRSALGLIQDCLRDMVDAYEPEYAADLGRPMDEAPSYHFDNRPQRDLARALLKGGAGPVIGDVGLVDLGRALATSLEVRPTASLLSGAPNPRPRLTVSPGYERRCTD